MTIEVFRIGVSEPVEYYNVANAYIENPFYVIEDEEENTVYKIPINQIFAIKEMQSKPTGKRRKVGFIVKENDDGKQTKL